MSSKNDKIAVIGMACRFPGAKNLGEYWQNLIEGKDTIKHFTDEELSKFEVNYDELKRNSKYIKARGVLDDIDKFDAGFFDMTPKEAAETDPQHRIWLETAWEAFENAGCNPFNYQGHIGVFAGGYINTYLHNNILRDPVKLENFIRLRSMESYHIMVGNDAAYIPTKTAYQFNLKGPAINIQTACSTSLVAISMACQSLFGYESDICLAGGVCIVVPQESGYIYQEGAIPSPDGRCRPFDLKGQGTVFSNGIGIVVLKRLEDALNDSDRIYALVSGWALNNDGKNKVSYLAPSVSGQAEAILMAQSFAGISPEEIGYVEAHGTATQLGDPIEINGLKKAFSKNTDKKQFCGIGSVKSNIGHTDAAAGVASFIKVCLAAHHRTIPPTINYSSPNKYIKFEKTPFYVLHELKKWTEGRPLKMGVSSFGIGGTNAHMIVEELPIKEMTTHLNSKFPKLIVVSAKCKESLEKRKSDLIDFVSLKKEANLMDISFTLLSGRSHMPYRSYMVANDTFEINDVNKFIDGKEDNQTSKIAFMFPGQGAQYVSMGRDLYKSNRLFKKILDECFGIINSDMGENFHSLLFEETNTVDRELKLARTEFAQPALFMIEYALAKILEDTNIKPDYLIGHGIGEYTAACLSGVFDLPSALKIVMRRGQLMQKMPEGRMMAVRIRPEKLHALICSDFEIAAENSPDSCYISFETKNYPKVRKILKREKIGFGDLVNLHALNSASFEPILSEFREYVDQFIMKIPEIPFISCLTGRLIKPEQAVSGIYWAQQLRNTVQFRDGVALLSENDNVLFLEVGPNNILGSLVKENRAVQNKKLIISTLGKPDSSNEDYRIISALGKLFNIGFEPSYYGQPEVGQPGKISLPTYPFNRSRHWIDFEYPKVFKKHH